MSDEYLRKQKAREKLEAERRAPKGLAKIISWIGGLIGLVLCIAFLYVRDACSDYAVYEHDEGSACGPFRMLYDFFSWLN
jgi:hypothetical protein